MSAAQDPFRRLLPTVLLWIGCAVSATVVAVVPLTYDTLHVTDTTFMAQVAAWVMEGAVPGRDFGHFYGGAHEQMIAFAYRLVGVNIKALDLALVLEFLVLSGALLVIAWGRLDGTLTACLALVIATTLFARQPFEEYPIVQRLTAAHSFAYNRLGTALTLLAALVVLVPSRHAVARDLGALVAGLCVALAVITKSTFLPVFLGLALGFAVLGRYRELLIFALSGVACAIALDPTMGRIFGTLAYSIESSQGGGGLRALVRKAFNLFSAQQMAVLAMLVSLGLLVLTPASHARVHAYRLALAAILVLGAFWASTVTMGPAGLAGHPALPMMAGLTILLWTAIRDIDPGTARYLFPVAVLLVLSFVVPHNLNLFGTTAKAWHNRDQVAFEAGPLSGYLAMQQGFRDAAGRELSYRSDRMAVVEETKRRMQAGLTTADTDYVRLIEAVRLMENVPNLEGARLVSDSRLGIAFALGLPRVEGFPAWLRSASPELSEAPLQNVDLVLIDATGQSPFSAAVEKHMTGFTPCRQSALWLLYSRSSLSARFCSAPEPSE